MYNQPLIFKKNDGGKFKIDLFALQAIQRYLQISPEMDEAGGVLLGRYILNSCDIVVDDITTPMKNDVRRRNLFIKYKSYHQMVITKRWIQSKGTCNYLGDWHTHPEASPSPSFVDLKEWKRLLKTAKFENDYLYFVIAGTEKVKVWEGNKYNLKLEEIVVWGEES